MKPSSIDIDWSYTTSDVLLLLLWTKLAPLTFPKAKAEDLNGSKARSLTQSNYLL